MKGSPIGGGVFGYKQQTEVVANSRQEVKVVFLSKEDSLTVKLIEPLEQNHSLVSLSNEGVVSIISVSNAMISVKRSTN